MYQEIFDKKEVYLDDKDIIAVFTVRDEIDRLPYFIEYYKKMGVKKFFAVDNDSQDGTTEFLRKHKDVVYFHTSNSYVSSKAGRYWTTELCDFYGQNRWCLTLDVDELLIFPGCENVDLIGLCEFMDSHNFEGLFTIFLDMYSDKKLSETPYAPGTSFIETCRYFDAGDAYNLKAPMYFPPVQIFGGPRQRIFWDQGNKGNGPSMRKIPLVKWQKDFRYYHSTHSISSIRLADFTGALLHFKFFASFKNLAIKEVKRGDRMQMADYQKYLKLVQENDLYFMNENSVYYHDSLTLVENGVIASTKKLINFIGNKLHNKFNREKKDLFRELAFAAKNKAEQEAILPLKSLPAVWSIVDRSLREIKEIKDNSLPHVDQGELKKYLKFSIAGDLLYCNEKYIGGWVTNPLNSNEKLTVVIFNNKEYLTQTIANQPINNQFNLDRPAGNIGFKIATPPELLNKSTNNIEIKIIPGGIPLVAAPMSFNGHQDIVESSFDGVCEKIAHGLVRGWVWNTANEQETLAISVYIDEEFVFDVVADRNREDLLRLGWGTGQYGYSFKLPQTIETDNKLHTLEIRIKNTGFHLRKTPVSIMNNNRTDEVSAADLNLRKYNTINV
ncbi:hypothetical protein Xen7305DRAFT_00043910 [Xenococcus sp. PCC 7305]|uniref:glycosyltransferase family 2 protein n=1 Tax=Xenococcus sp. PCC 7305 TaxID=102125 RepID=UPI0002AD0F8E|nr:glycosyltransferase family 2 protein [Xenococcus sp. PCC 7305]ELS04655.1 hypothetical protein Xen7305DRAFT_00043910 [Xenococcus sp. PCC 7305]